jgi:hypothetical protein
MSCESKDKKKLVETWREFIRLFMRFHSVWELSKWADYWYSFASAGCLEQQVVL